MKESEHKYEIMLDSSLFNGDGMLRPDSIMWLAASVIERHLPCVRAEEPRLLANYGCGWAFLSMEFFFEEAFKHLAGGDILTARTWFCGRKRAFFGRDMVFTNAAGESVFGVGTNAALLDMKTRGFYTGREAYGEMILEEEPPKYPNKKIKAPTGGLAFVTVGERVIPPSYMDRLGHMNNGRYGELAYDNLPEADRRRLAEMDRMAVYFREELHEGDPIVLQRCLADNRAVLCGRRGTGVERAMAGPEETFGPEVFTIDICFK